ncbi:MAG TPA: hypothetical protein VGM72_04870 [Micropepsaceae bacterium]|jgi:hypothetical protein
MNAQPWNFLLLVILGTFGAASGVGETAPIPDFSGTYNHQGIPGFEPLASGSTSLVNLHRRERNVSNNRQLVGDYRNPILRPETAALVKTFGEMSLDHYGYPTPRNQCWPGGVPFEFTNNEIQMLQTPTEILILYNGDHQIRHVRMNQSHPARVTPSWYGDSVGHYEGDTLVIDTVGVKVGPYAMVDWYGTPHSPALHVIERYRLLDYAAAKEGLERSAKENVIPDFDGKFNETSQYLQLRFTVEDPVVFTTPWSATITYERVNPQIWGEDVCAENPRKYGTEKDVAVPTAGTPDF